MQELTLYKASCAIIESRNKRDKIDDQMTLACLANFDMPLRAWVAAWLAIVKRTTPKHSSTYLEILRGNTGQICLNNLKKEVEQESEKVEKLLNWYERNKR